MLAGVSLLSGTLVYFLFQQAKTIINNMKTSQNGINLIKKFEGVKLNAYQDSVGVWTIGYGHTSGVKKGQIITEKQAENFLKSDLEKVENQLKVALPMGFALKQNQFDALVSFIFNLGIGRFKSSTLCKKLQANANDSSIKTEFNKWVYAGGKVLSGLVSRRKAESELYFS